MTRRISTVLLAAATVVVAGFSIYHLFRTPAVPASGAASEGGVPDVSCARIVSLAPSITETLFALGLGDDVVGVTEYCTWPPEARNKPRVGGFLDPNYEAIVGLDPTVVLVLPSHQEHRRHLARLGIAVVEVRQRTIAEILGSIRFVGEMCGIAERGQELAADLAAEQARVEQATLGLPRPGVLVVVDREMGAGRIKDLYIAGKGTFYDDLLHLVGGLNVYDGNLGPFPTLSSEGLLRTNPQVVLEIVPQLHERGLTAGALRSDWDSLSRINAVQEDRIHVIAESYAAVPGPRYVQLLEAMARAIHPEVDWDFEQEGP